ncbi:MAG TPA: hydroxymethylbilane synthase [Solirubrobacteraceae bacterium]|nr:hydroxymethylbilane synthase [Solirubrobacteraceae bacterium]
MRIGTRRSALALAQAQQVAQLLRARAGIERCELVGAVTGGDRGAGAAEKSRWVDELERALSAGEIDLAVHSAKDVPGELGDGLELLGAPARAAAEDVLCGAGSLEELRAGARVGTSSVRRVAQLRAVREDLEVTPLRGNVDTRLRKLAASSAQGDGDPAERLDAIVLARAGLQRLGLEAEVGGTLEPERFVPAPGQGLLALEGRAGDERAREAVAAITDADAFACLRAERALARALGASCHTPLGAHAVPAGGGCLLLRAWVGLPDGSQWIGDELAEAGTRADGARPPAAVGGCCDPRELGRRVAERLLAVGAADLLARAEAMAG